MKFLAAQLIDHQTYLTKYLVGAGKRREQLSFQALQWPGAPIAKTTFYLCFELTYILKAP